MPSDMLATGAASLAADLAEHAGADIAYIRGALRVEAIRATIGHTLMKTSDSFGGVRVERTDRDFIIAAYALTDFGEPKRGDMIEHADKLYEVAAPGMEPPWRNADARGVMLRIHTKLRGPA